MNPTNPTNPNEEPRRTSQPNQPGQTPPQEAPQRPETEWEKHVPHAPNQPVAKTGKYGEGSYEATRQYDEGVERFSKDVPPEEAIRRAKSNDPDDPELREAERKGKEHAVDRTSAASIP